MTLRHSAVELLERRRLLSAGDPDASFGVGGRVEFDNPERLSFLAETIALPDGKVVFAGHSVEILLADQDKYFFRRVNPDGTLDATFGTGGLVVGNFTSDPADDSSLADVALAPDGKIYAIGEGHDGFVLARFNANGSVDTTYGGGDGNVVIAGAAIELLVQADGKPLLLGHQGLLTRHNADGTIDTSFGGGDGTAQSPIPNFASFSDGTLELAVQSDDKILLGGRERDGADASRFALGRLNADGSVDTAFGDDGLVLTTLPATATANNIVEDLVPLAGGKFLAGGSTFDVQASFGGFVLVRYNGDGSVDTTFGTGGNVIIPFGTRTELTRILIDGDGNAILVGHGHLGITVARVTPDGEPDESFGRVVTVGSGAFNTHSSLVGSAAPTSGAALQADGKLVVAGQRLLTFANETSVNRSFLVRFHTQDNGVPSPVTFDDAQDVVSVAGTAGFDLIEAVESSGVLYAHRNGFGRALDIAEVQRVHLTGGEGNDQITADVTSVAASITGGIGSDKISGGALGDTLEGSGRNDFIDGNGGADLLIGGNDVDVLRGQAGNDTLAGGSGNDELRGGAGDDIYDGGPGADVEVDIDLPDVTLVGGLLKFFDPVNDDDQVSVFPDGAGGLVIYVDGATNTIPINLVTRIEMNGNGGNDLLKLHKHLAVPALLFGGVGGNTSAGGDDTLIGGAGNDTLFGNDDDDVLFANGGNDFLDGGTGSDVMRGHGGRDTAEYSFRQEDLVISVDEAQDDGAAGENDLVHSDIERIVGGRGNDRIGAGAGSQTLNGGVGNDTLGGGAGDDALFGADNNDRLDGGDGNDYLEGGAGNDVLFGGGGADSLFGLGGNDRLFSDGDGVKDTVRGGGGSDNGDVDGLDDVLDVETLS